MLFDGISFLHVGLMRILYGAGVSDIVFMKGVTGYSVTFG